MKIKEFVGGVSGDCALAVLDDGRGAIISVRPSVDFRGVYVYIMNDIGSALTHMPYARDEMTDEEKQLCHERIKMESKIKILGY